MTDDTPDPKAAAAREIAELLGRAALQACQHAMSPEEFMTGAWIAYCEANPAFKAHVEAMATIAHLAHARSAGKVAEA